MQKNTLSQSLNWYEMPYRGYDPTIGRFMQVDPLAEKYYAHTVYFLCNAMSCIYKLLKKENLLTQPLITAKNK